jgi:hypothetical protein
MHLFSPYLLLLLVLLLLGVPLVKAVFQMIGEMPILCGQICSLFIIAQRLSVAGSQIEASFRRRYFSEAVSNKIFDVSAVRNLVVIPRNDVAMCFGETDLLPG